MSLYCVLKIIFKRGLDLVKTSLFSHILSLHYVVPSLFYMHEKHEPWPNVIVLTNSYQVAIDQLFLLKLWRYFFLFSPLFYWCATCDNSKVNCFCKWMVCFVCYHKRTHFLQLNCAIHFINFVNGWYISLKFWCMTVWRLLASPFQYFVMANDWSYFVRLCASWLKLTTIKIEIPFINPSYWGLL